MLHGAVIPSCHGPSCHGSCRPCMALMFADLELEFDGAGLLESQRGPCGFQPSLNWLSMPMTMTCNLATGLEKRLSPACAAPNRDLQAIVPTGASSYTSPHWSLIDGFRPDRRIRLPQKTKADKIGTASGVADPSLVAAETGAIGAGWRVHRDCPSLQRSARLEVMVRGNGAKREPEWRRRGSKCESGSNEWFAFFDRRPGSGRS